MENGFPHSKDLDHISCLLYPYDAADDPLRVKLGSRRIIKKTRHLKLNTDQKTNEYR